MPSLFKRGDRYYVAFYDATKSPRRKQVSLRVSGYRAARARAARLIHDYDMGAYSPWETSPAAKGPVLLEDAVYDFLRTRQNLSPQSIQKYESVLGQFVRWGTEKKTIDSVYVADVQAFIDGGQRKAITKKTYSSTLSPLFNWCVEQGIMGFNPVSVLRLPKVQEGLPKVFSRQEVEILIESIEKYDT